MRRTFFLVFAFLLATTAIYSESAPVEPAVTQSLLIEIRQLRQDLQASAGTIQRLQILLYRIQAQTQALDRATQSLDSAQSRCENLAERRKQSARDIEQMEDKARRTANASERKYIDDSLQQERSSFQDWVLAEQECLGQKAKAEKEWRVEQSKADELQDHLDRLDKTLAAFAGK